MLWDIVELQSAQHPSRFWRRERLVERAGRVGRQIIEDDADTLGRGEVNVSRFTHTGGEVDGSPARGDFDLAPGPMDVEEDEQVGGSVALILAVVARKLAWLGPDRRADLADELDRALVKADHRAVRMGRFGIEIEHVNIAAIKEVADRLDGKVPQLIGGDDEAGTCSLRAH
jgi:hypothetical protein